MKNKLHKIIRSQHHLLKWGVESHNFLFMKTTIVIEHLPLNAPPADWTVVSAVKPTCSGAHRPGQREGLLFPSCDQTDHLVRPPRTATTACRRHGAVQGERGGTADLPLPFVLPRLLSGTKVTRCHKDFCLNCLYQCVCRVARFMCSIWTAIV